MNKFDVAFVYTKNGDKSYSSIEEMRKTGLEGPFEIDFEYEDIGLTVVVPTLKPSVIEKEFNYELQFTCDRLSDRIFKLRDTVEKCEEEMTDLRRRFLKATKLL